MFRRRLHSRADSGETLIEIVVSIVILGIAAVAIVGGMTIAIHVSDQHRKEATAGSYVRDFAEAIDGYVNSSATAYQACSTLANAQSTYGSSYTAPSGYAGSITAIAYLTSAGASGNPASSPVFGSSCVTDLGAQQLTIQVASTDPNKRAVETLVLVVRKPCSAAFSC